MTDPIVALINLLLGCVAALAVAVMIFGILAGLAHIVSLLITSARED